MTVKAELSFFGRFKIPRTLSPGTTIWREEEGKTKPKSIDALNVVIIDPDNVRITRYSDVYGGSPRRNSTQEQRLNQAEINQTAIRFPVFPGITGEILWEPTR